MAFYYYKLVNQIGKYIIHSNIINKNKTYLFIKSTKNKLNKGVYK